MERAQLAAEVSAEVMRRLKQAWPPQVAIGGDWPGWQRYDHQQAQAVQSALITALAPPALVRLAQGCAATAAENFLLEMLLLGKPVYFLAEAFVYHRYRQSAPPALYQRYVAAEEALRQMGVRPYAAEDAPAPKRRLFTAGDARASAQAGVQTLSLGQCDLITPLAQDMLAEAHIAIVRID